MGVWGYTFVAGAIFRNGGTQIPMSRAYKEVVR